MELHVRGPQSQRKNTYPEAFGEGLGWLVKHLRDVSREKLLLVVRVVLPF